MPRQRRRLDRGQRQPSIYSRTERQEKVSLNWGKPLLLSLLFILIGYGIFLSPFLKIKNVEVNEVSFADKNKINSVINDYRKGLPFSLNNNIVIFSSGKMSDKIGEVDGVKTVRVIKKYPSSIKIEITEKVPSFVWQTLEKKFVVDEKGYIEDNFTDKFNTLPVVIDTKNVPVAIGGQVVDQNFSTFISDLSKDFNAYTESTIVKIEVPEITSEIKVTSSKGWYVLFDTTGTAKNQLINLGRVLQEVKAKNKKLEYVDLRVDNRIFYK